MNYSYETVLICYWAESLLLAQVSMMYYESAPKIIKTGVHRSVSCIFVVSLAGSIFDIKFYLI